LSRLFALLNVTEIYRGLFPDLREKIFPYQKIVIKGVVKEGKFFLEEASMNAPTMNAAGKGSVDLSEGVMELTVLVAPLVTLDRIIDKIPVVRRITGGRIVSMAVKAKGPIVDPEVTPLPASAVGEGIVGMMKRTLKLPLDIITPLGSHLE
jgi:uncharacterized protein YhdP